MTKYYLTKAGLLIVFIIIYLPISPFIISFFILSVIAGFLEVLLKRYDSIMAFKWLSRATSSHLREKIRLQKERNS